MKLFCLQVAIVGFNIAELKDIEEEEELIL